MNRKSKLRSFRNRNRPTPSIYPTWRRQSNRHQHTRHNTAEAEAEREHRCQEEGRVPKLRLYLVVREGDLHVLPRSPGQLPMPQGTVLLGYRDTFGEWQKCHNILK